MSKVRAGAWALESERAEAEERERANVASAASASPTGHPVLLAGEPAQSFPSLQEASRKQKKKKNVPLSLSQLTTGTYVGPGGARRGAGLEPKGLTSSDLLHLPTGPRERTAEELEQSRHGGGFRSYGYGTGGTNGAGPRRQPDFGLDDGYRRGSIPTRDSDQDVPSRADEVVNWASTKKFTPTMDFGRQDRFGSSGNGVLSKADEVNNWKSSIHPPPNRNSGFGSGFRDSPISDSGTDRWVRGGGGSLSRNGNRERPRLVLDPPKRDSVSRTDPVLTRPSPFGAARPREEVLAEKGLDWRKMETEIETKRTLRPTSSQSSRPSSMQSSRPDSPLSQIVGGVASKPRPMVNPFGDAKPREVLLEEKGMDWRKIDRDLEHRGIERPDTDEEKILKEEIDRLRKKLAEETERKIDGLPLLNSTEQKSSLYAQIGQMEKELNLLIYKLDDKVRFGKKAAVDIRPGSGSAGRPFSADRPPSLSDNLDDLRYREFMERPRSRGISDIWSRPLDEQRRFQRSRDSAFFPGRSTGRSNKISGRW